ncbi:MAG: glycosyltransferase [Nitrososphaerota archaeon]
MVKEVRVIDLNESSPLVSVIIPTYNRAWLLSKAVESVLNQSYQNFEVIIIDDCSEDDTKNLVKKFKDRRIRYIRHRKRKGAAAARNTGIKAAKGNYIAFQDSDDYWHPKKLEKQMRTFLNAPHDLGVVYTSFWRIDGNKKVYYPRPHIKPKEGYLHEVLLKTNFIGLSTAVVKRKCFEKAGVFDEDLPRQQDWDLWLRISKYYCFKHIDEPLVTSYLHHDSISRNINAYTIAMKHILKKYFEEISKKPTLLGKYYFEIGASLCLSGKIEEGKLYFFKAIRTNPLNLKLWFSIFFSFLGKEAYNKVAKIYLRIKNI